MRLLVGFALAVAALGCARGSWLPSVLVSAETSRGSRDSLRVDRRRTVDGWRHRVSVSASWSGGDPQDDVDELTTPPRRARAATTHARRPPCRSQLLCRWEHRSRMRALRALAHPGDEP